MKACVAQKVRINLPHTFQTVKSTKSPVVKGVSTKVTEHDFKEFIVLSKINYTKAEQLESKKTPVVIEMFK